MIRIAIVERDPFYQSQLQGYLKEYGQHYRNVFQLTTFSDGHEIIDHYDAGYDIILLDTELGKLSGMETAKLIRDKDENAAIILISDSPKYAIQGYQVEALGYIIKPFSQSALSKCLDKAIHWLGFYLCRQAPINIIFDAPEQAHL